MLHSDKVHGRNLYGVLCELQTTRASGILSVRSPTPIDVLLKDGQILFTDSEDPTHSFPAYLLQRGLLEKSDVLGFMERANSEGTYFGALVLDSGMLTEQSYYRAARDFSAGALKRLFSSPELTLAFEWCAPRELSFAFLPVHPIYSYFSSILENEVSSQELRSALGTFDRNMQATPFFGVIRKGVLASCGTDGAKQVVMQLAAGPTSLTDLVGLGVDAGIAYQTVRALSVCKLVSFEMTESSRAIWGAGETFGAKQSGPSLSSTSPTAEGELLSPDEPTRPSPTATAVHSPGQSPRSAEEDALLEALNRFQSCPDWYTVLGLEPDAPPFVIEEKIQALETRYNPSRYGSSMLSPEGIAALRGLNDLLGTIRSTLTTLEERVTYHAANAIDDAGLTVPLSSFMEAQRLISQSHERASIEAFDEAEQLLLQAMEHAANDPYPHLEMVDLIKQRPTGPDATDGETRRRRIEAELRRACALAAPTSAPHRRLGEFLLAESRAEEAVVAFQSAMETNPQDSVASAGLRRARAEASRQEESSNAKSSTGVARLSGLFRRS